MPSKKHGNAIRRTRADVVFDTVNLTVLTILMLMWIYPLYFVVIASFSEPYDVVMGKVFLFPSGFTLEAYKNVLENKMIWTGYANTILYTLAGTTMNLVMTIPCAYALNRKILPLKNVVTWVFLFTMFFGGGLIPSYLLHRDLGLVNTRWVMILGGASVYNLVVTRTFFTNTIPEDLYEAAKIDGARELSIFWRIAFPLSAPIVAVMALYYGVGRWNEYFNALIYISDKKLEPLQLVLRRILILNENAGAALTSGQSTASMTAEEMQAIARRQYMAEGIKYSVVFIASAPLLCAYPFIQKYFVKGVMIGSLKG